MTNKVEEEATQEATQEAPQEATLQQAQDDFLLSLPECDIVESYKAEWLESLRQHIVYHILIQTHYGDMEAVAADIERLWAMLRENL